MQKRLTIGLSPLKTKDPQYFPLIQNLVLYVSGSLGVVSILRKEIMAALLERGSERRGNPIQIQKYEYVDGLSKTKLIQEICSEYFA